VDFGTEFGNAAVEEAAQFGYLFADAVVDAGGDFRAKEAGEFGTH
jgi:hypothetical protein